MADAAEKARLLSILEGHGRSFLNSFAPAGNHSQKRTLDTPHEGVNKKVKKEMNLDEDEDEEEWFGIGKGSSSDDNSDGSGEEGSSDFEHTDDEFTVETVDENESNVVIFSDPSAKKETTAPIDYVSKAQMKAFMSSKISKLSSNTSNIAVTKQAQEEEEEDKTNAQNDAILHKLVHTKLLSGSLSTELDLTPAQRRKALAGRILELTGQVKLGKGERAVRDIEKKKASKQVREGLASKQKERNQQELEEAKHLGNYHPTLKKVYEASGSTSVPRKREKGLKMGVGRFSNGSLKLSQDDVNMAMGSRKDSSSRGRGRGRGRGNPGKRR